MGGGKDIGIAARYSSRLAAAPQFSYLCICLLQLKIIWRIWEFQELIIGDTSYYFLSATEWHRRGRVPFAWSPLYTSFFGTFLRFTSDTPFIDWRSFSHTEYCDCYNWLPAN